MRRDNEGVAARIVLHIVNLQRGFPVRRLALLDRGRGLAGRASFPDCFVQAAGFEVFGENKAFLRRGERGASGELDPGDPGLRRGRQAPG